jgi:hypothetical protein
MLSTIFVPIEGPGFARGRVSFLEPGGVKRRDVCAQVVRLRIRARGLLPEDSEEGRGREIISPRAHPTARAVLHQLDYARLNSPRTSLVFTILRSTWPNQLMLPARAPSEARFASPNHHRSVSSFPKKRGPKESMMIYIAGRRPSLGESKQSCRRRPRRRANCGSLNRPRCED